MSERELLDLLVSIQWGGECASYGEHCPSCRVSRWATVRKARGGVVAYSTVEREHAPDCALWLAIRPTPPDDEAAARSERPPAP